MAGIDQNLSDSEDVSECEEEYLDDDDECSCQKSDVLKERLLVTIFVCPSVLWLTFLSHFRYFITFTRIIIIIITLFLLSTTRWV